MSEGTEQSKSGQTPGKTGTGGLGGNSLSEGTARSSVDESDLTKGERRRGGQGS